MNSKTSNINTINTKTITFNQNMKNTAFIEDVLKFHKQFNQPVQEYPSIPTIDRCELRVKLLKEEVQEFEDAIEAKDIVEIADALADTMYVLCGAILEFGLGDKFYELFQEVQRSNMTKACINHSEAKLTIEDYKSKNIEVIAERNPNNELYSIYRKEDRKVLKSINYNPANLKPIIEK